MGSDCRNCKRVLEEIEQYALTKTTGRNAIFSNVVDGAVHDRPTMTPSTRALFVLVHLNWLLSCKDYYQAFFWVLIDLIVELLGLIIKPFDNQAES